MTPLQKYDASVFDWSEATPSVFASDLGILATSLHTAFLPVSLDSADLGIILYNPRTKIETVWVMSKKLIANKGTADAELMGWEFRPTSRTAAAHPALRRKTIKIFND